MTSNLAPIFGGPPIKSAPKQGRPKNLPWVEKYRPSKVDEISYQTEVVAALKGCLDGIDLPHMLFYGPAGTGKTTSAVAVCKQLFRDQDAYEERVLELNASDERGISVVRNRIKEFAQRLCRTSATKRCAASVKIIILDEADAMTSAAQMALRRIMETESRTTRFFIICNYVSKIIAPLASRCVKFRFKPLPNEVQVERLRFICGQEKVEVTDAALESLVKVSEGDLRKSITRLQSLSLGLNVIDAHHVAELCGQVDEIFLQDYLKACQQRKFESVEKIVEELQCNGFSPSQFIKQLAPFIIDDWDLKPIPKARILIFIADIEQKLLDGSSGVICLSQLGGMIQRAYAEVF